MGIFSWKGKKSLWTCCKKGEWAFLKLFSLWSSNIRERRTILFLTHYVGQLLLILMRGNRKKCHQSINIETTCFMCLSPRSHTLITFFIWRLFFKLSLCRLKGPAEIPSSWFLPDAKYFAIAWSITHVFPNYMIMAMMYKMAMSRGSLKGAKKTLPIFGT